MATTTTQSAPSGDFIRLQNAIIVAEAEVSRIQAAWRSYPSTAEWLSDLNVAIDAEEEASIAYAVAVEDDIRAELVADGVELID